MHLEPRITLDPTGIYLTVELLQYGKPVAMTTCGPADDTGPIIDKLCREHVHEAAPNPGE